MFFSEHSVGKPNIKQNQNFPELCPGPHLGKLTALPSPLSWWGRLVAKNPGSWPCEPCIHILWAVSCIFVSGPWQVCVIGFLSVCLLHPDIVLKMICNDFFGC